jgi:methyltransferase (TIGR00027 family)
VTDSPTPTASRTALGVATLRAVHQLLDDEPRLLDDPYAARLLGPIGIARIHDRAADYRAPHTLALRAHVLLRSRYAEDRLAEAVACGVRQYVILGAGLDTSALRVTARDDLARHDLARDDALRVFEVDQDAGQAFKRHALAAAGIAEPPNVTWVPADLARDDLTQALRAHGFDDRAPAFVTCLGVLMYLDDGAADAVLRFAASLPHGSEIVFTYAPPRDDGAPSRLAEAAAAVGEPWRWHVTEDALRLRLRELGFHDVTFVSGADLNARYVGDRRDGLRAVARASLVRAAT